MTEIQISWKSYLMIGAWLAGLMLLGVALSELPAVQGMLAKPLIALIVLLLSTIKATLVALYYMHLKFDRRLLAFVAAFPLVLITLATLLVLSSRLVRL